MMKETENIIHMNLDFLPLKSYANIVEGNADAETSIEMGIKLINVAKASLKELLTDYEDYLRVNGYELWREDSDKFIAMRKLGVEGSSQSILDIAKSRSLDTEPCPMCAGALAWSQIGKVVYGASDPKRGFSMFSPSLMHPKTEVVSGVLADECGNMVTEFFRNKRQ